MTIEEKYEWYKKFINSDLHKRTAILIIKSLGDFSALDDVKVIYNGADPTIAIWSGISMPMPTPEELAAVTQAEIDAFSTYDPLGLVVNEDGYLLYGGDAYLAQREAAVEAQRQSEKPLERKQYENAFFSLIEQVLTLANEPVPTPIPKLGFSELNAMIESLQVTHTQEAIFFALKLLSVDAALKRYDSLWWDDVYYHTDI